MVKSMVMGTSKWVAVPLNAHSIHETRKRYTIQKVIYLGHIKALTGIKLGFRLCCQLKVQTGDTGFKTYETFLAQSNTVFRTCF